MIHRFTYACLFALLVQSSALAQNTQKTDNALRVSGETSKLDAAEPELSSDFSPEDLELRSNDGRGTASDSGGDYTSFGRAGRSDQSNS